MERKKAKMDIINWMLHTGDAGRVLRLLEEQAAKEEAERKVMKGHSKGEGE